MQIQEEASREKKKEGVDQAGQARPGQGTMPKKKASSDKVTDRGASTGSHQGIFGKKAMSYNPGQGRWGISQDCTCLSFVNRRRWGDIA